MRGFFISLLLLGIGNASGQIAPRVSSPSPTATPLPAGYRSPSELKKLPLEQLVDIEITSASRRPAPLSQASSAVSVITGDEIRRAAVTNLPDALRLGPAMEVAQIDGHTWAILSPRL